jgi:hypothetical protein
MTAILHSSLYYEGKNFYFSVVELCTELLRAYFAGLEVPTSVTDVNHWVLERHAVSICRVEG